MPGGKWALSICYPGEPQARSTWMLRTWKVWPSGSPVSGGFGSWKSVCRHLEGPFDCVRTEGLRMELTGR